MKHGTVWKFTERRRQLNNDVRIELWKINRGLFAKDDKLGSFVIKRGHRAGQFVVAFDYFDRGTFATAAAANYLLQFRVDR
jgi:hypothetical protein